MALNELLSNPMELAAAHVTGLPAVLAHLGILALVVAYGILGLATGLTLYHFSGLEPRCAAERLVLSASLGIGGVGTAILVVGSITGFHVYALLGLLGLLGALCVYRAADLWRVVWSALQEVLQPEASRMSRAMALGGPIVFLVLLLLLAIAPVTDYDSLAYHLQVLRHWIDAGQPVLPPDNYHVAYIGVGDALYLPLVQLGLESGSQVLNVFILCLLPLAVFAAGRAIGSERVGRIGFWLTFGSPILLITGITPMVDVTLAVVLTCAHLAAFRSAQGAGDGKLFIISVALLGIGAGVKYTGLLYGLALTPLYVIALLRIGKRSGRILGQTSGLALLVVGLTVGPWAVKNDLLLGDPVFPFGSAPRVEPWLRPLYPDLKPTGVDPAAFSVIATMREPFSFWRLLLAPATITSNANANYQTPFWVLFFAPLALLGKRRWAAAAYVGPPLCFAVMLLGISRYTNLRYLIPAIPGLTVGAAIVLTMAWDRLSQSARYLLLAVTVILATPSAIALHALLNQAKPWKYAVGLESWHEYLARYWETAPLMAAVDWVHVNVPEGQNVVMLFESRGFYFDREVREDINIRNWPFLAPFAHSPDCLRQVGASFILLNEGSRRYYFLRGKGMPSLIWGRFDAFRRQCLTLRYNQMGIQIFEVKPVDRMESEAATAPSAVDS